MRNKYYHIGRSDFAQLVLSVAVVRHITRHLIKDCHVRGSTRSVDPTCYFRDLGVTTLGGAVFIAIRYFFMSAVVSAHHLIHKTRRSGFYIERMTGINAIAA